MNGSILVRWENGEGRFDPPTTVTLGRDPGSSVVLDAPSVSRHHAELRFEDGTWSLVDEGSTQGTHAESGPVSALVLSGPTTVVLGSPTDGERIELVPDEVIATEHGADDEAAHEAEAGAEEEGGEDEGVAARPSETEPPGPRPHEAGRRDDTTGGATIIRSGTVTVSCGGRSTTIMPGQSLLIGRDPGCDLVSTNQAVSRRHARVHHDGAEWLLDDVGSSGGTFVDGRRVTSAVLSGPTTVRLGDPETGERVDVLASGAPRLSPLHRIERTARRRPVAVVTVVAVLVAVAVIAGLLRNAGGGSSSSNATLAKATVMITVDGGSGSGTIIDAERGLILTNAHVASPTALGQGVQLDESAAELDAEPRSVVISVAPGLDRAAEPRYQGTVVAADGYLDLAVVKVTRTLAGAEIGAGDLKGLSDVPIGDSDSVKTGDDIRVVGFPSVASSAAASFTKGVVSGAVQDDRLKTNRAYLNVDAQIAPGNSGGLAVDRHGRLIGVPSLVAAEKVTGARVSRIRPVDLARDLLDRAKAGKSYTSPYVSPLTHKERISVGDATPLSDGGFTTSCAAGSARGAQSGDEALGLSLTYRGFSRSRHQDVRIQVKVADTVVGEVATNDQYPFRWGDHGCVTATVPLEEPLTTGHYDIEILVGPNYEKSFGATLDLTA